MSEYKPTEYVVDFGDCRSNRFVGLNMVLIKQNGAKLHERIVRCRDCVKWHHIDTLDGVRYGECDEWKRADSYCVPATRENGFCAWATCKCGEDIETNGRESVTCPSCGRVITE